ncbi:MAG TPA: alpha/beta hydrolase [Acidimicrobiales bacterium]|nr:alpha/beta hydrolase [Acidimicrobiales bacterium]
MAPRGKQILAYAAAGALGAAGIAYGVSRAYASRRQRRAAPDDPDLGVPADVVHHALLMRDGGESHLIERGVGPAVLLLHGASLSADVWSYQLRDLAEWHRVIALDLRGHGRSSAGSEGVTISAMAGDVAEVVAALDLERAVLAGHSLGGMVCLRLARRHPHLLGTQVGAIALISTSDGMGLPLLSWDRLASAVGRVAGSGAGLLRAGRPAIPAGDVGYLASRLGFGRHPRPAQVAATLRMLRATEPGVFTGLIAEVLGFEERAPFGEVGVPVAIAVGTSDRLTPPHFARRLAGSIRHASLNEYVDAGHMLMYERREEIDDLLDALCAKVASS